MPKALCPMCGEEIEFPPREGTRITCSYCNTELTIVKKNRVWLLVTDLEGEEEWSEI